MHSLLHTVLHVRVLVVPVQEWPTIFSFRTGHVDSFLSTVPVRTCHNSPGGHESSVSGVFVEDLRVGEPDGVYLQSLFGCVQKPAGRMQVDFMPISGDCFVI